MAMEINKKQGQATLEFILAFGVGFIFIAGIIKIALGMTTGYLAHYASYMAARHYLVFDSNSNNENSNDQSAANSAQDFFKEMGLINYFGKNTELSLLAPGGGDGFNLEVGARLSFTQNFFSASLFGGRAPTELISEAFLGRSVSQHGCYQSLCEIFTQLGGACTGHVTLYDDGC
jgi:hypothetical protein